MGFLRKHWTLLVLLLLLGGVFLAVNKPPSVESASPSPSVFLASPLPSVVAPEPFVQEIPIAQDGEVAPIVLRQELEPETAVEKTVLENPGTRQADFVLLKVFPEGVPGGDLENLDALSSEKLSDNVFKFRYSLASGGKTEFRVKGKNWGVSLIYPSGLFSEEQEKRLAALLEELASLNLSTEELQAFQKIANGILNDDSLSPEEKLGQLKALVDAVKKISEEGAAASMSPSARANAIEKAGELLRSGGIPALQAGLDEIIDEVKNTRACERLPKSIELNVSRCLTSAVGLAAVGSSASFTSGVSFRAVLAPNESTSVVTPCNPSSIELNVFKNDGVDKGALVSRFSESLSGLLNISVFQQDTALNASLYVNLQKLNQTQPWPQLNESADGFVYANVSKTNMTVPFLIDPSTEAGNTLLASLILSSSIDFKNLSHLRCFNEYREQGKRLLTYYDKALQTVNITLAPLSIKYNRGAAFSCTQDSCAMPSDSCALVGRKITFNYFSQQAPGTASIKSGGTTQTESTYDLPWPNGGFDFTPAMVGKYDLSIAGKIVSFEVKQKIADCIPQSGFLPISADCPPYLTPEGTLKANALLFEVNDSAQCNEGIFTGTFSRVVNLPCNAEMRVCSHYYTLGSSSNPGAANPFSDMNCDPEYYKAMSLDEFLEKGRFAGYCAIKYCFGDSVGKDQQNCHDCFAKFGIDGGEKFEVLKEMLFGRSGLTLRAVDEVTAACKALSKPALYLYPEKPLSGMVTLETSELVFVSDPLISAQNDWTYYALPDGKIFVNGTEFPYLFYETTLSQELEESKGWVVAKENVEKWFFEMLPKLGLNEQETNDFADYWVSRLPQAKFYEIRLIQKEKVDRLVRVVFDPEPDVFVRVILLIKPTEEPALLALPLLNAPERTGFVAAEWGVILED